MDDRATDLAEERMGIAIDAVENMSVGLRLTIPEDVLIEQFREKLPEIVAELKLSFVQLTGKNPWIA